MSQSRQLAAIMFTDIVGYTALMEEDEERAFVLLKENRQLQRPLIDKYNGKWLKEIGDGVLASFSTVSDAVYCAIELQKACNSHPDLNLRIGIHQGEVVFEEGDVFGSGVNIASRLEPLAPVGGIIISESVHRNILNKKGVVSTYIGKKMLKGVREPVKVYQLDTHENDILAAKPELATKHPQPARSLLLAVAIILLLILSYFIYTSIASSQVTNVNIPGDSKSIAVLPFVNMSTDPQQDFFSEGISEELLNALVKIPGLNVAGRTSSWVYKDNPNKDLRVIGKELGVSTILEGSVRKSGKSLRITAQLVNTSDGFHLWSDTYDIDFDAQEIFAVQDKITMEIIEAMRVHFIDSADYAEAKSEINNEAYLKYLQARQKLNFRGEENLIEARRLFEESIQLDSSFSLSYSGLGRTLALLPYFSEKYRGIDVVALAKNTATKARTLNPNNSEAYIVLANVAFFEWDWSEADIVLNKALILDPNNSEIFNIIGDYYFIVGDLEKALEMEQKALNLDPLHAVNHHDLGMVYASMVDWENALKYATSAKDMNLEFGRNTGLLFYSNLKLKNFNQAEKIANSMEGNMKLLANAMIAVSKNEGDRALSYINEVIKSGTRDFITIAELYFSLEMYEEATFYLRKGYMSANHSILGAYFEIPSDHPVIQKAIKDMPKVIELYELISSNLSSSRQLREANQLSLP